MCVLKQVLGDRLPICGNLLRPGPKPKFTDIEVIALSLTAECMSIDSELNLFYRLQTTYKDVFPNMISRRQFNDRRKSLKPWLGIIRQCIADTLNEINEVYAIDSMPLEICKIAREERNKMGKEDETTAPDKGYCASQKKWYYGYKLHAVCSPSGVIQVMDLSKASVHDINYLKDVSTRLTDCIIAGDRGYINHELKQRLWNNNRISLETPLRSNQKDKKPLLYVLRKIRKRVETVFSQLCDQFMIQRNYAKSYTGFSTRILSKICGMTILQYINKYVHNTGVGRIKYALM